MNKSRKVLLAMIVALFATATSTMFGQYVPVPNPQNSQPPSAVTGVGVVTAVNATSSYAVNISPGPVYCQGDTGIIAPTQLQLSNPNMVSNSSTASPTTTWYISFGCTSNSIVASLVPSAQQGGNLLLATVVVGCNTCLTPSNDIQTITATTSTPMFPTSEYVLTFSATPTINILAPINTITLTANVTSSTFPAGYPGQPLTMNICENGTGGFTFAFPANVHGATAIVTTANKCNSQTWFYSAVQSAWIATGTGVTAQ